MTSTPTFPRTTAKFAVRIYGATYALEVVAVTDTTATVRLPGHPVFAHYPAKNRIVPRAKSANDRTDTVAFV